MSVKDLIKKILTHSCIYFSFIMLFYIIIQAIVNVGDDTLYLDAVRSILFFVFSLLLAIANIIYCKVKIPGYARLIIHYLICIFAAYCCFFVILDMRASQVLVGIALLSAVWAMIMGIWAAVSSRYRKNKQALKVYESKFKKTR